MRPGADLGVALASIDRTRLSESDRVMVLQAWSRQLSHTQAELYASMVSVADAAAATAGSDLELAQSLAASEIRAALTLTRRAADSQLDLARELLERHPRVWEALHQGRIDLPKARVIIDQTAPLDQETARQVAKTALEKAGGETTGQLRARIGRLVISVDPDSARERYEQGLAERRVVSEANPSGTANLLGLDLPAADTTAAMRRINRMAQTVKTGDDPRTLDQIRADLLLDLLNGTGAQTSSPDRGTVDIQVDLTTLLELHDKPGEIHGWGPVISDIARQVIEEQVGSEWRYTVTGENGNPIAIGTTRRRPTAGQKRLAQTLNPTCVFPGCRIPSIDCDLDHNQPWSQNGPTREDNLGPLCRHHHVIRHHGWNITQTSPGSYQLTSPLGHTYTSQPRAP